MAELWQQNSARLREWWAQQPPPRQKTIALSAVISLLAAGSLLWWAAQPRYTVLYDRLAPEDAGAIIERLKGDKVPYRLTESGTAIAVPASQMYEQKMRLATDGLPQISGPGWELFDKSPFGMTEFTQKLNYLRALQGELARTIMQLSQVQSARVHLTMPEASLYEEEKQEPTASVVLTLKGARSLQKQEIKGVVHLVSSAVAGMKPENVTIIDSHGAILSSVEMAEGASPEQAEAQLQSRVERKVQRDVQSMLDKVLGPDQALVRVRTRVDFSRRETSNETYAPGDGEKGVLQEEHLVQEEYAGRGGGAAQVPGIASNTGGLPGLPGYRAAGGSFGGNYVRKETTSRFNVSKKVEHLVTNPGETTRLSIAVMVNGDLEEAKKSSLAQVVSTAAGLDAARGDRVSVVGMKFDDKAAAEEKKQMAAAARQRMLSTGLRIGLAVLMMVFVLLVLRQAMRRPMPSAVQAALAEGPQVAAVLDAGRPVGELIDAIEQTPAIPRSMTGGSAEGMDLSPAASPAEERLRRLAMENPEFVARLLRSWLIEQGQRS